MSVILWIILVILILILTSRLAKLLFGFDHYLGFLIMIRTTRFIKYLDRLAKAKKILNVFADIGIVLGFGAFGFDYLIKDKIKNKFYRFLIFIGVAFILTIITYFSTYSLLTNNPLISHNFMIFMVIFTGIMGLSGFTMGSLVFSAFDIIAKLFAGTAGTACPGVGLVIPGVKMPKMDLFIPWYGWLILIFSAIIHEFAHGALLRTIKVKIKSMGFILAAILPLGAFVEPNDKDLLKKKKKSIIRMYSAGPTSNTIIALVFFVIVLLVSPSISNYTNSIDQQRDLDIYVYSVDQTTEVCGSVYDSPAYGVLDENDIIVSINGVEISSRQDLTSASKLDQDNLFVVKNKETGIEREVNLKPNEMGSFGFTSGVRQDPNFVIPGKYKFYKHTLAVLVWIAILNLLIATVNYLPTVPFDGGAMSQIIFSGYLKKKRTEKKRMRLVQRFFGTIIVILLLLNIIPYFF